jgi:chlorobactene glucosyltransferase
VTSQRHAANCAPKRSHAPKPAELDVKAATALTHLCAGVAIYYAWRAARFAPTWVRVPVVRTLAHAPAVSVIVPARDEERSIERCVRSLLAQTASDYEVIVVDDRSRDRTRAILDRIAAEDERLRVVEGAPLPPEWIGKPWALHQGAALARGRWLLFTDADSVHASYSITSALAFTHAHAVDALSTITHQELGTFAERAILPSILGLVFFSQGNFRQLNDPAQTGRALANGQYIFISRRAYDGLGGHAALRGEIVEDVELARRFKADGRYRLMLAAGESLASVRMYHSFDEIWNGFTKNIYFGPRGNLWALGGGVVFIALISFVPPLLALNALVRRRPLEALEALLTSAALIATGGWAMASVGLDRRLGWFQPLGTAVLAAITVNSTFAVLSGRGVEWRGRRYGGGTAGGTSAPSRAERSGDRGG